MQLKRIQLSPFDVRTFFSILATPLYMDNFILSYKVFNSFLSSELCHLLTFVNSLDPDQDQQI